MAEVQRPLLELGFWLSSEEHDPKALVRNAARAEEVGFRLAGISDHFHPWVPQQGQSPFVWSVLGAIDEATEQLRVGTSEEQARHTAAHWWPNAALKGAALTELAPVVEGVGRTGQLRRAEPGQLGDEDQLLGLGEVAVGGVGAYEVDVVAVDGALVQLHGDKAERTLPPVRAQ